MRVSYKTPQIEILEVRQQDQIVCASGGRNDYDQEDW